MTKWELETGIEIPSANHGRVKYPLAEMKVGDSFFIKSGKDYRRIVANRLTGAFHKAEKAHGFKFIRRQVEGGIRVWRVA